MSDAEIIKIYELVLKSFGLTDKEIKGEGRTMELVDCRRIIAMLLSDMDIPYYRISKYINRRDRNTQYLLQTGKDYMQVYPAFRLKFNKLKRKINES